MPQQARALPQRELGGAVSRGFLRQLDDGAPAIGRKRSFKKPGGIVAAQVNLLLGLGVDELSSAPSLVPPLKFLIRRLKLTEARELAAFALDCESAAEILARCQELACAIAPGLFDNK